MDEKKKSNVGMIVLIVVICALVGVIGFLLGNKNFKEEDTKLDDTVQGDNTNTSVNNTNTSVENTNYIHVFEIVNNANGYNVYSYLGNQGWNELLIEYNGGLYYIEQTNQTSCIYKLYSGNITFDDNLYDCSEEDSSGSIRNLNLKTSDISNAYIIQSNRSDGASFIMVVFKNGTVNRYFFIESGRFNENYFDGSKVSSIENYECSQYNYETGQCNEDKFTVKLQDGSTKEIYMESDL